MSSKELFFKTMPFIWAKLLIGLIFLGISILLFGITFAIGLFLKGESMDFMMIIWIILLYITYFIIMHYFGYLLKAGHIAVIVEAKTTGIIPENQIEFGKQKVKEKFATSNVYFLIDKLVSGAVRQIQSTLGFVESILGFIPGISIISNILKIFVKISLGYIDECCLGWTFRNKEQNAFKSAADGVVIYAQNWKYLLKISLKTTIKTILFCIIFALIIFIPVALIFTIFDWSLFLGFIISFIIALIIKYALLDAYIMICMLDAYMNVAPDTTITFDLYEKLCKVSSKFKKLFNKGEIE